MFAIAWSGKVGKIASGSCRGSQFGRAARHFHIQSVQPLLRGFVLPGLKENVHEDNKPEAACHAQFWGALRAALFLKNKNTFQKHAAKRESKRGSDVSQGGARGEHKNGSHE